MTAMTSDEKQGFLAGLHVGVLGVARDGRGPLTVPVWYDYEPGGDLWFITGRDSLKGRLIEVGTVISMCAQQEALPYVYVTVEGPVVAVDDHNGEIEPMAIRYLGNELGRQYAESSEGDSVVIRMHPEQWLGVDYGKSL